MNRALLLKKYQTYQTQGTAIFAVTLSTYVQDDRYAAYDADNMRRYWDHDFIYRVRTCLPMRAKIDHDWVLERSPGGHYHYHGFLAVEQAHATKLWCDGALRSKLKRAIDSHATAGKYRGFCINAHLIEPVTNVAAWACYITKQNQPYD